MVKRILCTVVLMGVLSLGAAVQALARPSEQEIENGLHNQPEVAAPILPDRGHDTMNSIGPAPEGLNCADDFENGWTSCYNWTHDVGWSVQCVYVNPQPPFNCLNHTAAAGSTVLGSNSLTTNTITVDNRYTLIQAYIDLSTVATKNGLTVEVSYNGGGTWYTIDDLNVGGTMTPTFNSVLSPSGNPVYPSGEGAYSGTFKSNVNIDLSDAGPGPILLRLREVTNQISASDHTYVDNVESWIRPLNPPVSVSVLAQNSEIIVRYNVGTDDPRITKYNIYRATAPGGPWGTPVHTSLKGAADVGAWQDTNLLNGTTYYYKITNADMYSQESAPAYSGGATPNCIVNSAVEDPGKVPQRGISNRPSLPLIHVKSAGAGVYNVTWSSQTADVPCGTPGGVDGIQVRTSNSPTGPWTTQNYPGGTTSYIWGGDPAPPGTCNYITVIASKGTIDSE